MSESVLNLIPEQVRGLCSLTSAGTPSCLEPEEERAVAHATGSRSIDEARQKTGCNDTKCVIERAAHAIGAAVARDMIKRNFKLEGPTDNSLLSDINIDNTLRQWAAYFKDFFPYNFNMRNYAQYHYNNGEVLDGPDTLATINVADLYAKGFRRAACVINSDKYQGGGIHWMCLYVDMPGKTAPATVEFFNSAGGCAQVEWHNWLVKTKTELKTAGFSNVQIVNCGRIVHQDSMSECGVYSLYYTWARLNGIPAKDICARKIPDKYMFEFRQHLFANPIATKDGKFAWDEYQKQVKIKWQ